jgi:hypothetical protein
MTRFEIARGENPPELFPESRDVIEKGPYTELGEWLRYKELMEAPLIKSSKMYREMWLGNCISGEFS